MGAFPGMYEVQTSIRAKETPHPMPSSMQPHSGLEANPAFAAARAHFDSLVDLLAGEQMLSASHAERGALALREANVTGSILVLTTDAKGVVMRPQGLRDETRRAAERAERKLRTRLSSGEKTNRKRMAQVAAVDTVAAYVRTPDEIVRGRAPHVAAGIRRSATRRGLTSAQRERADDCADYVLKLRSVRSSGDFEEYWAFHQRRELERVHLSDYAGGAIPKALLSRTTANRTPGLRLVSPPWTE